MNKIRKEIEDKFDEFRAMWKTTDSQEVADLRMNFSVFWGFVDEVLERQERDDVNCEGGVQ